MDVADHVRLGQRKKISSLAQPTIGNKQMSAGRYTILTVGDGSIAIQDRDTGASALSLARTESRRNVSPKLVFHHVGNHYFLAQIWSGVGGAGLIVPSSKLEKELQIAKGILEAGPETSNREAADESKSKWKARNANERREDFMQW
jgi:hypothetical protein